MSGKGKGGKGAQNQSGPHSKGGKGERSGEGTRHHNHQKGGRGKGDGKGKSGGKGAGREQEDRAPRGKREIHAGNRGHPTTGGNRITPSVARVTPNRDERHLPYPINGKRARQVHQSTGRVNWTIASWADWHTRAVQRRNWRKAPLRRVLAIRQAEARARGDRFDYFSREAAAETNGMIYGAYHCPTGRWYVGQTINTIWQRVKQHWYSRRAAPDYLHLALADDPDPMTWIALPLEAIRKEL